MLKQDEEWHLTSSWFSRGGWKKVMSVAVTDSVETIDVEGGDFLLTRSSIVLSRDVVVVASSSNERT